MRSTHQNIDLDPPDFRVNEGFGATNQVNITAGSTAARQNTETFSKQPSNAVRLVHRILAGLTSLLPPFLSAPQRLREKDTATEKYLKLISKTSRRSYRSTISREFDKQFFMNNPDKFMLEDVCDLPRGTRGKAHT
ncbi:hypothetical protein [Desulfoluna limicola]|uniref:hypothetical protein n=1 Tax=Desulfoluna limicola TaxID=2810562 RepID=UPI001F2154E9|nr:hypothetical protein [Desulfoluna limicola]